MKTDSLFYLLFQLAPGILFELMGQPGNAANRYEFRSVELKQTAFRIDGVLLPTAANLPVYFCEVQFQKDLQLYHRFFAELFLYLTQNPTTHDWHGILIYPDRSLEPDDTRLYQLLIDSSKVQRVYLNELGDIAELPLSLGIVKLVIEPEATAPIAGRALIQRLRQESIVGISNPKLIELVETIMVYKFNTLSREEIEAMLGLDSLKQTKVYQEALQEGRQEGRQEGQREGQREMIENLLQARFGVVDADLAPVVAELLKRSPAEYMPLLLQLSRQELIDRFPPAP